jgi:predicted secreted protein
MTVASALAVYFVIWWTVLFAVLPFGVRSQSETGEVVEGTEPGAPALPGLGRKAAITSLIAAVVFVFVWYGWAALDL